MRYIALIAALLLSLPAHANMSLDEIKLGFGTQASAVVDADEPLQPWLQHDEGGLAINGELLFKGPAYLRHIWTPRIQLGGSASLAGETNYVYTGLYWDRDFCDTWFVAGFFGLALHDGTTDMSPANPNYNNTRLLGNRVLFRLGPEIGYRIDNNWSISGQWAHLSHGWILNGFDTGEPNEGLDQLSVRVGYKF
ncbi:MAG: acyloxyacyl hydrolase [Bdellovibrionales bacterium]